MGIKYDDARDAGNMAKHGLLLVDATIMDVLTAAVSIGDRGYGEPRFRAFSGSIASDSVSRSRYVVPSSARSPSSARTARRWNAMADKPIVFDNDNSEWSDEDVAWARSSADVLPADLVSALKRGRPRSSDWQQVTLRLPSSVIEYFKAAGPGWQTRAIAVLE